MKKSFMTRALATGLSLAMAFSLSAATNVTTAEAATSKMKVTSKTVTEGKTVKTYMTSSAAKKYRIKSHKESTVAKKYISVAMMSSRKGLKITAKEGALAAANLEKKGVNVKINFVKASSAKAAKKATKVVDKVNLKVVVKEEKLSVAGVTATNATTLTVTGTKLGDLTATDIVVTGNVVSSYTAAADGKSATIVLGTALVPDSTTDVTINGTTFAVKYAATTASAVELTTTTFDNDTANQQMKLKVNGAEMSVSELYANGYEVKFYAYETMSTASTVTSDAIFKTTTGSSSDKYSTDGIIKDSLSRLGSYYVKAIIVKAGVTLESAVTEITILDLDTQTTGVNKVKFVDTASKFIAESTGSLNLVQGDLVDITSLNITNGGKKYDVGLLAATTALKSSNPSVLTVVDYDTVKAYAAGTSTLTVTYGEHSIAISVTVDKNQRKFASIKADGGNVSSIVNDETATLTFYAVDDHGAIMTDTANIGIYANVATNTNVVDIQKVGGSFDDHAGDSVAAADGKVKFEVKATATGSTSIQFFQADKNTTFGTKVSGASSKLNISLSVVAATRTTYGLVSDPLNAPKYVQDKTVSTLDLNPLNARAQHLVLKATTYKNGVASVTAATFGGMAAIPGRTNADPTIFYDSDIITVEEATTKSSGNAAFDDLAPLTTAGHLTTTKTYLDVEAKKAGTTTIVIKDGTTIVAQYTVTVVDTRPVVGSITPKNATFGNTDTTMNVGDIFDLSFVKTDTWEVKGVTYSANATSLKVMYTKTGFTDNGVTIAADHFYIYNAGAKDAEATYLDLGCLLGVVTSGTVQNFTGPATQIKTDNISILPADAGTLNLYLSADTTLDNTDTLIATVTVQ